MQNRDHTFCLLNPAKKVNGLVLSLYHDLKINFKIAEKTPTPTSFGQGDIGNCWFISALGAICHANHNLPLVENFGNDRYVVHFYDCGTPTRVEIDDLFIFKKVNTERPLITEDCFYFSTKTHSTLSPVYARPRNMSGIWAMVVEKAYAKFKGSYDVLIRGRPSEAYFDIIQNATGSYIYNELRNQRQLAWDTIINVIYKHNGSVFIIFKENFYNIVKKHAYAILDAYDIAGVRFLKIHNPWSAVEMSVQSTTNKRRNQKFNEFPH